MAKMKPEFENIVENSFNDGFNSEPEIVSQQQPQTVETPKETPDETVSEYVSEKEILLKKLRMGETDAINDVLYKQDRSTYFITELQRECINVKARVDCMIKQDVVQEALNKYFENNPRVVEEAKREVIRKKILRLEKDIEAYKSELM